MILKLIQFSVLPNNDPNLHIASFFEIYNTFKYTGVIDDAIRLRLFPFSLRDKSKMWLNSLSAGTITTWEDFTRNF